MFGKKAFFKVTSVVGHIYVADFEQGYQDWRTVDPFTLFDAPTIKKEANPAVISHCIAFSLTIIRARSFLIYRARHRMLTTWSFGWIMTEKARISASK